MVGLHMCTSLHCFYIPNCFSVDSLQPVEAELLKIIREENSVELDALVLKKTHNAYSC